MPKAKPIAPPGVLPDYLEDTVMYTLIKITNTGDGLSEAMAIEPQLLDLRRKYFVVLECECVEHAHKVDKDGLTFIRQTLAAGTAVIMEAAVIRDAITKQAERVVRYREQQMGTQRLPYDQELATVHNTDGHPEPVPFCPECEKESAAKARKRAANKQPGKPARRPTKRS